MYQESLDPKDVLSTTTNDMKVKLCNLPLSKMVRGLLETEPLHFTCVSASEGTKIERADNGTFSNSTSSVVYCSDMGHSWTTNKDTIKPLSFNEFSEVVSQMKGEKSSGGGTKQAGNSIHGKPPVFVDAVYEIMFCPDGMKSDDDFSKISKYRFFERY